MSFYQRMWTKILLVFHRLISILAALILFLAVFALKTIKNSNFLKTETYNIHPDSLFLKPNYFTYPASACMHPTLIYYSLNNMNSYSS